MLRPAEQGGYEGRDPITLRRTARRGRCWPLQIVTIHLRYLHCPESRSDVPPGAQAVLARRSPTEASGLDPIGNGRVEELRLRIANRRDLLYPTTSFERTGILLKSLERGGEACA